MSDSMSREDRWADLRQSARPRSLVWAALILGALFLAYSQLSHPLAAGLRMTWLAVGVCAAAAQVWRMTADANGRDEMQMSFICDGHRAGFMVAVFGALCVMLVNQAIGLPVARTDAPDASARQSARSVVGAVLEPSDYVRLDPGFLMSALLIPLLGSGAGFIWSARKRTGR